MPPSLSRLRRSDSDGLHRIAQNSNDDKSNSRSKGDIIAVPAPVPDSGIAPTALSLATASLSMSSSSAISTLNFWSATSTQGSTLTVLPHTSPTATAAFSSSVTLHTSITTSTPASSSGNTSRPSIPLIVAIAASASVVLLGALLVIRRLLRPRRSPLPVPSRPIFNDASEDSKLPSPDSPLFGGKERFSQRSEGVAWTIYPHRAQVEHASQRSPTSGPEFSQNEHHPKNTSLPPPVYSAPVPSANQSKRISRSKLRHHSEASLSVYPLSPSPEELATYKSSNSRKDGDSHLEFMHCKKKALVVPNQKRSDFAYDGADVASPLIPPEEIISMAVNSSSSVGGRSKIRSAYFATGPYPHMSLNAPIKSALEEHNEVPVVSNNRGSQSSVDFKSEECRARDTKALTSALGLTSPALRSIPASPATIYPDDSLSMIFEPPLRIRRKSHVAADSPLVPSVPARLPEHDTGSALGHLMLADLSDTSKSLLTIDLQKASGSTCRFSRSQPETNEPAPPQMSKIVSRRSSASQGPPRVPSPPPIPPLAQIALERSNPESYAEYRSPTFSIYDLYRTTDRRSRI